MTVPSELKRLKQTRLKDLSTMKFAMLEQADVLFTEPVRLFVRDNVKKLFEIYEEKTKEVYEADKLRFEIGALDRQLKRAVNTQAINAAKEKATKNGKTQ